MSTTQTTDLELLRLYARRGNDSQRAFEELVARHADWIYSAARREVRDVQLAEDVTQAVFLALAQQAGKLSRGEATNLGGWLFRVTRYAAAHVLRSRARSQHHEMKAAGMREETSAETESLWREIEPRLDELVWRLRAQDRDVLLLRFYQRKSMAEVGTVLGVSEDAAKKRVSRAVENLRKSLGQQGIVVTGSALALPLLAQTTHTAPPALISACNTMSTASATGVSSVAGIAKGAIKMIVTTNIKFAAVTAGCAIAVILLSVGTVLRTTTLAQQAAPQPAQAEPPPATRPKDPRQRTRCALNLKAVGMSILLYRNDHKGNYPPDLGALLVTEKLKGTELLCPEGNTTLPADWAAMSNVLKAEWINAHADYTYAGAILTSLSGADSVVGYDKDETLHGDGMNVLFADGRVIYMKTEAAKKAIDDSARRAHANP